MADEIYGMSRKDVEDFKALIREYRTKQRNRTSLRDYDAQDYMTPEVYVARTPTGGIPALEANDGTGTAGTGTATDDEPGSAECSVYFLDYGYGTGTGTSSDDHMRFARTQFVYNLSSQHIPEHTWILAVRDKFGTWYHVATGPGSGSTPTDGDRVDWITIGSNTPTSGYYPGTKVVVTPANDDADPVLVKKIEGECFLPGRDYLGKYEETVSNPTTGTGEDIEVYSCSGNDKHCVVYCDPVTQVVKRDMWFLPAPFDLNVDIGNDCGTGAGTSP